MTTALRDKPTSHTTIFVHTVSIAVWKKGTVEKQNITKIF